MDIIRRLRGLLKRRTDIELQDFDLNDVIRTAVDFIVPEATKRGVELSVNPSSFALPVRADPLQLQQVVLNLAINGMDAMQSCASDKRKIAIQSGFAGKSKVEVLVSDLGTGIADGNLTDIFEPFYTTKSQGIGLGLSISRTIVEAFGGKDAGGEPARGRCDVSLYAAGGQGGPVVTGASPLIHIRYRFTVRPAAAGAARGSAVPHRTCPYVQYIELAGSGTICRF